MSKKIEPMGDIMHEVEAIVTKMVEQHDLQKGEMMALFSQYIDVHFPGSIEEYNNGSNPVYYYGPRKGLKNAIK